MKTHASKLAALTAACVLAFGIAQPAHALFGVGDIVLDPTNLVQNTLTAVRTLEQINNQIRQDRKSTRLNSSHSQISYAVFCLKKKKKTSTYVMPYRHS